MIQGRGQYIKGEWIIGNGAVFASINPAYGTLLWQGVNATDAEIVAATQVAHQALPAWAALDFEQRAHFNT